MFYANIFHVLCRNFSYLMKTSSNVVYNACRGTGHHSQCDIPSIIPSLILRVFRMSAIMEHDQSIEIHRKLMTSYFKRYLGGYPVFCAMFQLSPFTYLFSFWLFMSSNSLHNRPIGTVVVVVCIPRFFIKFRPTMHAASRHVTPS